MNSKAVTNEAWKIVDGLLYDAFMCGARGESMDMVRMRVRFTSAYEHGLQKRITTEDRRTREVPLAELAASD